MANPHFGEPIEVLGYAEIAAILGVTRQRAAQIALKHKDFPPPVASLKGRPLYTLASVREFAGRDRKAGRPPKDQDKE